MTLGRPRPRRYRVAWSEANGRHSARYATIAGAAVAASRILPLFDVAVTDRVTRRIAVLTEVDEPSALADELEERLGS